MLKMPLFGKSQKSPAELVKALKEAVTALERGDKKAEKAQEDVSKNLVSYLLFFFCVYLSCEATANCHNHENWQHNSFKLSFIFRRFLSKTCCTVHPMRSHKLTTSSHNCHKNCITVIYCYFWFRLVVHDKCKLQQNWDGDGSFRLHVKHVHCHGITCQCILHLFPVPSTCQHQSNCHTKPVSSYVIWTLFDTNFFFCFALFSTELESHWFWGQKRCGTSF